MYDEQRRSRRQLITVGPHQTNVWLRDSCLPGYLGAEHDRFNRPSSAALLLYIVLSLWSPLMTIVFFFCSMVAIWQKGIVSSMSHEHILCALMKDNINRWNQHLTLNSFVVTINMLAWSMNSRWCMYITPHTIYVSCIAPLALMKKQKHIT